LGAAIVPHAQQPRETDRAALLELRDNGLLSVGLDLEHVL
jgi:hypothetical protein